MRTLFAAAIALPLLTGSAMADRSVSTYQCDSNGTCVLRHQFGDGLVDETICTGPINNSVCINRDGYVPPPPTPAEIAAEEARKAEARRASGYRDPGAIPLCMHPYYMTARDGCQAKGYERTRWSQAH